MMKLYTFSKNSWHVKFYKWLYNKNPTNKFKTMCPYFWTYVLTFILLPFILVVKLFGKYGNQLLTFLESYKRKKNESNRLKLKTICSEENITPEKAYKIKKSKCWANNYYWLNQDIEIKIRNLSSFHWEELMKKEEQKMLLQQQRLEKYEQFKSTNLFKYSSYIITGITIISILGFVGYLLFLIVPILPWLLILKVIGILILTGLIITGLFFFIKNIIIPFISWLQCKNIFKCTLCSKLSYVKYIFKPFVYIFKGFIKIIAIIGDMIYSTYKKQCPIITWED